MQFIGGPMDGQQVPGELRSFINSGGEEIMPVRLLLLDAEGCLVEAWEVYIKTPYFRLGKPLIYFYAYIGMDEDQMIMQARERFGL